MKFRKMLALLLVFVMLSALIACGSDAKKEDPTTEAPTTVAPTTEAPTTEAPTTEAPTTTEPTTEAPTELVIDSEIIGTWRYDMPFAEMMEQALLISGFECDVADDTVLAMTLTFNEDGTCVAKADEESAKAMLNEMLRAMSTVMGDMLYAEFERQQGWDKATTDAQLEAQGMTMASLVEQSMAQVDTSSFDISSSFESESYYMVEGDTYYAAPTVEDLLAGKYTESMQFVIDGDQMQFLDCEIYNEDAASLEDLVTFPITLTRE